MGLKGGMAVVEVVVKWNDGGIGEGEVVDSFDEMSITFVLANFLRGFLVEEDALKASLKVINEGSYGWEWDRVCNCPPSQFLVLDKEWERVIWMILKEFVGEAFFFGFDSKSLSLSEGDYDVIGKMVKIRDGIRMRGADMLIQTSKENSIGKCHNIVLGYTFNPFSDVVCKVELFSNGETMEQGRDEPICCEHAHTFTRYTKDSSKLLELEANFNIVDDKGDGKSLI
ncbi:hypothetical protein Tco_1439273 [Tanacetum coccineum]